MGEEVEKTLIQFCDSIEDCLEWHEHTWLPLQQQLEDLGFRWEKFLAEQPAVVGSDGELVRIGLAVTDSLSPVLDSRFKKLKLLQLNEELRDLKNRLKLAARLAKSSKVIAQLLETVKDEDSSEYRSAYERLLELKSRQADLDLRRALLAKLETAAPAWAGAIRNRTGVHGRGEPPRDPASAWTWRQLNDELDRRAGVSLEALQVKSEKLREQLRRASARRSSAGWTPFGASAKATESAFLSCERRPPERCPSAAAPFQYGLCRFPVWWRISTRT